MAVVKPDVWVLTETRLSISPGNGYQLIASSEDAPDRGGEERWTAVWVRTGMSGNQVSTADPERTACAQLSGENGRDFYIYGTVLPWLSDRRRDPLRGAAAFMAALADQEHDWERIRRDHPDADLCVAGDLNQDLLAAGHYYGSAAGRTALRSALVRNGLECLTGGESDPVLREGGGASIDHICVDRGCRAGRVVVWPQREQLGRGLSDHHGVAVDLLTAQA